MDILVRFIEELVGNSLIKSYVGSNITTREMPDTRVDKQITLRKTFGKSNSIITATNPTVFVTIWVRQKGNNAPYKTCTLIMDEVIRLFNRTGEEFNKDELRVNQIVKTDAEIKYDASGEYYVGVIVFDCVTNEQ